MDGIVLMDGEDDAIMVSPHVKSSFSDSLTTATVTLSISLIPSPLPVEGDAAQPLRTLDNFFTRQMGLSESTSDKPMCVFMKTSRQDTLII